ncbi:multisubunit sodium/proton antiporter, MrpD subunit [Desulfobulbus propionicus DSM 2032]|jgi:multicomponent Na+:H+ antiporter subunit D|uniref:Multisubunit sodium/proton antiporter, MrpD subunit n=1 Tax=Desulfobulbus propionicus (strain ATCC 33891 / DSM 2032 / VKM B-1956 / 1pr3) TaxID=577650 RepID=A0A7U3YKP2_DESPD|nr:Na(+)/H(+) antiporter subunit D [Desulfobulbus propionicus]ADW17048.1 multisubunit sodium/proton antiporter, MrpD subunit [Desulfobulbus propionicus DSM 2032]
MTSSFIHPSVLLIVGALLLPLVQGPLRKPYLFLVPLLALGAVVLNTTLSGTFAVMPFLDWQLVLGRVDKLSTVFALIMAVMAVIGTLYGLQVDRAGEHMAAWFYAAGSLGVIYSGDYLSLFLFWEMMAFASVFLVWFRRGPQSLRIGYRYLLIHTIGGIILLAGILLRYQAVGNITFDLMDVAHPQLYTWLIMIGFGLNAAMVPLHSWLPEAYSEASFNGAVFLCAFTTKTAVYTLARACAGMEILVVLGVIMALYGVLYAVMENDIRKLLAWSIVSQVGYMVAGIGIGTDMAINGAVAHAVVHILYKSLLFMGTGSVLYMTGKTKFTELGGLYAKMPATFFFTMIGCLSISAAPCFAAYASKSLIITAGFEQHLNWAAWLLMFGATGTFMYNGLKLPYFLFFGKNNCSRETWERAADPAWNMLIAMTLGATLCVLVGTAPGFLYALLPHAVDYTPHTMYHLMETLQLLGFAALAFFLLKRFVQPVDRLCLDVDWLYRKAGCAFLWLIKRPLQAADTAWGEAYRVVGIDSLKTLSRFWSWFDWQVIDGVVDGLARSVRVLGGKVRILQSGQIQLTLYYAFSLAAVVLVTFIFFQLL